jgi:hypothetical protein
MLEMDLRYSDDSFTTVEDQNTEKNVVEGVNKQVCADREACNYCPDSTQSHSHPLTALKYSNRRMCRKKASLLLVLVGRKDCALRLVRTRMRVKAGGRQPVNH